MESGRSGTAGRTGRLRAQRSGGGGGRAGRLVLIGSGLLMRSFVNLRSADLGFQKGGLLTFRLRLVAGGNKSLRAARALLEDLLERVADISPEFARRGFDERPAIERPGHGDGVRRGGPRGPSGEEKTYGACCGRFRRIIFGPRAFP